MKFELRTALLLATFVLLAACGAIAERDKEMLGKPSAAVAMYAAQSQFANDMCTSEGFLSDSSESEGFVTMSGRRGLSLSHYLKHYPEFSVAFEKSLQNYANSASAMSQSEKSQFCNGFAEDVEGPTGTIPLIQKSMDFQRYFSPPTEEFMEQSQNGAAALAVMSVASTAMGVAQTNSGNFANAQTLNDVGGILADGVGVPESAGYCASYAPFAMSNMPSVNQVWRTYNSIQRC